MIASYPVMRPDYTITIPSVNKKPGKETPTRLRRTRSAEKILMVIFWDKYSILLTEYLPHGTTISGLYYAFIIERLHYAILKKRVGKVSDGVLLLHDNATVHKNNTVHVAIRKGGFVELDHPAYSPDIAPSDCQRTCPYKAIFWPPILFENFYLVRIRPWS